MSNVINLESKIAVIGSGAMGSAIAKTLYDSGFRNVVVYGINETELADLSRGRNIRYFGNAKLPLFKTTMQIEEAVKGSKYIFLVVPSIAMDSIIIQIKQHLSPDTAIVNCSKGFYPNTTKSLHSVIEEKLSEQRLVVSLIGPSHAEEIVLESPTKICSISKNISDAEEVSNLFKENPYFRVEPMDDVIGAELGSAYKNVLAIVTGISQGQGYGINTQAAIMVDGLEEMKRFIIANGGKEETIMGLTGLGDLIVTATSTLSRNFNFGVRFAKEGLEALNTKKTVEGLSALNSIYEIAKEKNIDIPLVNSLYNVINKGFRVSDMKKTLLNKGVTKK